MCFVLFLHFARSGLQRQGAAAASCLSEIVSRRPLPLKPFGFFERVIYLCFFQLLQRFNLCL